MKGGGKCDVAREIICLSWTDDGIHFMQIGVWGQQNPS